jgi:Cu/Ag efflux pump CusA
LNSLVKSSVRHRWVLVVAALLVFAGGFAQLRHAKVDALPEFNAPRVEVQTEALGLSAQEVEQLLTVPLERNHLNGIPFLKSIKSRSVPGLSSIEMIFEPGTNLFTARQLVQERLSTTAELPNVSKPPQMLQAVSSASRVMIVGLSTKQLSPIELSVLTEFTIRPRLLGVPGVAGVSVFGARDLQLQIQLDPARLLQQGVSVDQVITTAGNALFVSPLTFLEASTPGSGGFFDSANQRLGIQHILPIKTPADLSKVAIADAKTPLRLGDVATVVEDHQPLIGDASLANGQALLLVVEKLPGANTGAVTHGLETALNQLKPSLKGIQVDGSIYRPQSFVDQAVRNLRGAATAGALLGFALLALLLFSWRAVVVAAVTIPLSVVAAASVLALRGETFNSVVVAGLIAAMVPVVFDVVATTTAMKRREQPGAGNPPPIDVVVTAVGRPLTVATVIVGVGLAPFLFLDGLSVKSFLAPAALSYGLAVVASLVVALTVAPAVGAAILRTPRSQQPRSGGSAAGAPAVRAYRSLLTRTTRRPVLAAVVPAVVIAALGVVSITHLRPALVPSLQETDLLVHWNGPPGTSLDEMGRVIDRAAGEVRRLPGILTVGTHTGRAVTADQVVGSNSGEMWISVKPSADHDRTVTRIHQVVGGYPGFQTAVSTFFNDRVKELQGSSGADLVVRVEGIDFDIMTAKGAEIERLMGGVKGVKNAHLETQPQQPTIQVTVDLAAADKAGIKPGDIRRGATTLVSGLTVGSLFQDQKVFQVVVVGSPALRHDLTTISDIRVDTPNGGQVRLGDVAKITVGPSVSVITHNDVARTLDITANVKGRSVASAAKEITAKLRGVTFPSEYDARVLAAHSDRTATQQRLLLAGVLALVLIFLVLQAAFSSWRLAALAVVALPLAVAGGAVSAWADGAVFTMGSLLGLVAVGGLAVRSTTLLLSGFRQLEQDDPRLSRLGVVQRRAVERGLPTGVTAVVTGAAFVPFLLMAHLPGAEIVRPLAVAVLGGLLTTALVTLVVLPAGYLLGRDRRPAPLAEAASQPGSGGVSRGTESAPFDVTQGDEPHA